MLVSYFSVNSTNTDYGYWIKDPVIVGAKGICFIIYFNSNLNVIKRLKQIQKGEFSTVSNIDHYDDQIFFFINEIYMIECHILLKFCDIILSYDDKT